jgi:hypothetical protein
LASRDRGDRLNAIHRKVANFARWYMLSAGTVAWRPHRRIGN